MSVDYERYAEQLVVSDTPFMVIVEHRYDGPDGYVVVTASWSESEYEEVEAGWDRDHVLGFLENDVEFRADLLARGFVEHEFATLSVDDMRFITYNICPIEWHRGMEVFGERVKVYVINK